MQVSCSMCVARFGCVCVGGDAYGRVEGNVIHVMGRDGLRDVTSEKVTQALYWTCMDYLLLQENRLSQQRTIFTKYCFRNIIYCLQDAINQHTENISLFTKLGEQVIRQRFVQCSENPPYNKNAPFNIKNRATQDKNFHLEGIPI